jgi:2'-5' RNA ligase
MRLFIAVELGDEVRRRIKAAVSRLQPLAPNAKWVGLERMHVTLVFIGAQPDSRVPEIEDIVEEVAGVHRPVTLKLEKIGAFGRLRTPRVLWCGLEGDLPGLGAIKNELEQKLIPLGYQPEKREFKPHLTLARARDPKGDAALALCVQRCTTRSFGELQVDRLVLFRSDLSPKGAKYTPLAEPALRA